MLVFFFPIFCFDFILLLSKPFLIFIKNKNDSSFFLLPHFTPFVCVFLISFFLLLSFFFLSFLCLSKLLILGLGGSFLSCGIMLFSMIFFYLLKFPFFPKIVFSLIHSTKILIPSFPTTKKRKKKVVFESVEFVLKFIQQKEQTKGNKKKRREKNKKRTKKRIKNLTKNLNN